jgi:hypothetical protein
VTTIIISNNTGADYSGTDDTYIDKNIPTTNNNAETAIEVNAYSASIIRHGLVRFTLPGVLSGATINSATLTLTTKFANSGGQTVGAYRCLKAWTEGGATWNKYDGSADWTTAGGYDTSDASATLSASASNGAPDANIDLTGANLIADVQAWASGTTNNGWLLKRTAESSDSLYVGFYTSEGTDGSRPKLTVDYTAGGSSTTPLNVITPRQGVAFSSAARRSI